MALGTIDAQERMQKPTPLSTSASMCTCDQQSHICTAGRESRSRRSWKEPSWKTEPAQFSCNHYCIAKDSSMSGCEIPPEPSDMSAHISRSTTAGQSDSELAQSLRCRARSSGIAKATASGPASAQAGRGSSEAEQPLHSWPFGFAMPARRVGAFQEAKMRSFPGSP